MVSAAELVLDLGSILEFEGAQRPADFSVSTRQHCGGLTESKLPTFPVLAPYTRVGPSLSSLLFWHVACVGLFASRSRA